MTMNSLAEFRGRLPELVTLEDVDEVVKPDEIVGPVRIRANRKGLTEGSDGWVNEDEEEPDEPGRMNHNQGQRSKKPRRGLGNSRPSLVEHRCNRVAQIGRVLTRPILTD